jgi:hypothetical protein
MASRTRGLPSRFPVGTKFVIEGRRRGEGQVQVYRRFLEFPDGTRIRLPPRPGKRPVSRKRATRAAASRKRAVSRKRATSRAPAARRA